MSKYDYRLDLDDPDSTSTAIYDAVTAGGRRVLDVGSGAGIVSARLVQDADKIVTCLDLDAEALAEARDAGVHHTHVVDLRSPDWFAPILGASFDVVVLADVLEHVIDPERILKDLVAHGIVDPDGRLVISIPNASHEAVIAELATGHFRYTDSGLLDRTHVRFFTLNSATAMLGACGYFVSAVRRTRLPLARTRQRHRASEIGPELRAALDAMGPDGQTFQFILTARPATEAGRLAELGDQLEEARKRIYAADVKRTEAERSSAQDRDRAEQLQQATEIAEERAASLQLRVDELSSKYSVAAEELARRDAEANAASDPSHSIWRRRLAALRTSPDYRRSVARRVIRRPS